MMLWLQGKSHTSHYHLDLDSLKNRFYSKSKNRHLLSDHATGFLFCVQVSPTSTECCNSNQSDVTGHTFLFMKERDNKNI